MVRRDICFPLSGTSKLLQLIGSVYIPVNLQARFHAEAPQMTIEMYLGLQEIVV
jgi:hypothetical protein